MQNRTLLASFLIASTFVVAKPALAAPAEASASFSVTSKTLIPGDTLKPGEYSIQIVDSLSDRMIVRVDSKTGTAHALFLGVRHGASHSQTSADGVELENGPNKLPAMRGFSFPTGSSVEFVYPKADAVALAKLNSAKVVAIDPESEGLPAIKGLSRDDLQVVNLWMLSLTTTGPSNSTPAILAQKYDTVAARPTQPTVAASAKLQPAQVAQLDRTSFTSVNDTTASRPLARRHPAIVALPHTASALPLIWTLGLLFLLGAFLTRLGGSLFRSAR